MAYAPPKSYNALPLLTPDAELAIIALLKQCIAVNRVLAEQKRVGRLIVLTPKEKW